MLAAIPMEHGLVLPAILFALGLTGVLARRSVVFMLMSIEIMLNSAGNGNHWLMVGTTGRVSNRDGIGARLKLTTSSGRALYNHITTSAGFMSSSDVRAHFGLGKESAIKSLEVQWPSGAKQVIENVKPDQVLKITEP